MNRWWLKLGRHARPHIRGLSAVMALMVVGAGLEALKPWPLKLIVDHVLSGHPLPPSLTWMQTLPGGASLSCQLGWLVGGTVLIFLTQKAIGTAQAYAQVGVGSRMVYGLSGALFDRLQRLSLNFHGNRRNGDLVRRVTTDSACIRELMIGVCLPILTSAVSLATMFTVMWRLDAVLALLALLVVPVLMLFIKIFDGPMAERTYRHQELEGEMLAMAEQTLSALPMVQAFGREEREGRRFELLSGRALRAYVRAVVSQTQFKLGISAATAAGAAGIMALGGMHVLEGRLTVGSLLVFLSYLASLYAPLETLAYASSGFATAAAKAHRVLEVLESEEEVNPPRHPKTLPPKPEGRIRIDDVSFGYLPDAPVLHHICLDIPPGQTLALVGPTGAGKSTLVSLIPRFFDPWMGTIAFDGCDIKTLALTDLRNQIALVLQDPFLLPLTVAENIAYGRPDAAYEHIVDAAEAAHAHDFIQRLPNGYDTVLAERGASLSGGQKQRIAIARALLKDAPVLILDEPTAALDAQTEALVVDALARLRQGRTAIVIAHRLSTIRHADCIAVLSDGHLVQLGTHHQLIQQNGPYRQYCDLQFGQTVGV